MCDDFEVADVFFDCLGSLFDGSEFGLGVDLLVLVLKLDLEHVDEVVDIGSIVFMAAIAFLEGKVKTINPGVDIWSLNEIEHPDNFDVVGREIVWLEEEPVVTFSDKFVKLLFVAIKLVRHGSLESHVVWAIVIVVGPSWSSRR